jgi:hypothetical protein
MQVLSQDLTTGAIIVAFKSALGGYMTVGATEITAGATTIGDAQKFVVRQAVPWAMDSNAMLTMTYGGPMPATGAPYVVIRASNNGLLSETSGSGYGQTLPGLLYADGIDTYYPSGNTVGLDRTVFFELEMNPPAAVNRASSPVCVNSDYAAGRCYPHCSSGYAVSNIDPSKCVQTCPSGYRDDGVTCFRDANIVSANTSNCPWYDACGLTLAPGCSTCPSGYHNDGCTCRIDAYAFSKAVYTRSSTSACASTATFDGTSCQATCALNFVASGSQCLPAY